MISTKPRPNFKGIRALYFIGVTMLMMTPFVHAQAVRTQSISLVQGWNAIFVEVHAEDNSANAIFGGTPVDIAVAPLSSGLPAQFSSNPDVNLLNVEGWGTWYEESGAQAFLNTLFSIPGGTAYLVHSRTQYTLEITGEVRHAPVDWQPDQFNLVGFSVMAQGAPTFSQFFQGARAFHHNRIYRLVSGTWHQVLDPSAAVMRSGESFWIFCDGASQYQGPLRAVPNSPFGMVLGAEPGLLALYNDADYPVGLTLEHIATGEHSVPLSIVVQTVHPDAPQIRSQAVPQPDGDWTMAMPPIEAQRSQGVPLQARLEDMVVSEQSSLLRVTTDIGTETWISVKCIRKDLEE